MCLDPRSKRSVWNPLGDTRVKSVALANAPGLWVAVEDLSPNFIREFRGARSGGARFNGIGGFNLNISKMTYVLVQYVKGCIFGHFLCCFCFNFKMFFHLF